MSAWCVRRADLIRQETIMNVQLVPLADLVLPLIRTRSRELWRYNVSNAHGAQMHEAVDVLEAALDAPESLPERYEAIAPTPKEVFTVTTKALSSAIRVIARADDSSGIIGSACYSLIDLHSRAAAAAGAAPLKLADWMYRFHFDEKVDYFDLDPVAYAPALGVEGLARLREHVEALRAECAAVETAGEHNPYGRREWLLSWFDKRFAVLDEDLEAIIRTHLGEGKVPAQFDWVAEAFEEIGRYDLAIEWAQRAVLLDRSFQAHHASRHWWKLLETHKPEELAAAAATIFHRWPDAASGARLITFAGKQFVDEAQRILEDQPAELVTFQLETLGDPRLAWDTAHRLPLTSERVWTELAEAYFPIGPAAAIGVQLRLVSASLEEADTRKYRPAARELTRIRKGAAATGPDQVRLVDLTIAALRERYKRRPSMIAAFDRARLP